MSRREAWLLLLLTLAALIASGIGPYDRLTWLLEVAPVLIALPRVAATRRLFPLTPLLYRLLFLHGLILLLGGDADECLATQGDPWDTQWDMFLALVGALAAQLLLGRRHDRQLAALAQ
ncbi:MAG TPA: hypothetical protein VNN09_00825 [Candidatus Competibacteraceae bacterium]|nr:hypothetical protein [Candidatus Competibacteraceae bacterium]